MVFFSFFYLLHICVLFPFCLFFSSSSLSLFLLVFLSLLLFPLPFAIVLLSFHDCFEYFTHFSIFLLFIYCFLFPPFYIIFYGYIISLFLPSFLPSFLLSFFPSLCVYFLSGIMTSNLFFNFFFYFTTMATFFSLSTSPFSPFLHHVSLFLNPPHSPLYSTS